MKRRGKLFQERFKRRPFWMLVACVLVNRTRWSQAEPIYRDIRRRWPSATALAIARISHVERILKPLGLSRNRSSSLVRLAREWLRWWNPEQTVTAEHVKKWPGCGKYAADSWAMFVEGRRDVRPTDAKLKAFIREETEECQEQEGRSSSVGRRTARSPRRASRPKRFRT